MLYACYRKSRRVLGNGEEVKCRVKRQDLRFGLVGADQILITSSEAGKTAGH